MKMADIISGMLLFLKHNNLREELVVHDCLDGAVDGDFTNHIFATENPAFVYRLWLMSFAQTAKSDVKCTCAETSAGPSEVCAMKLACN